MSDRESRESREIKLINDINKLNQKYSFLYKYLSKSGDKTYKFSGYNCSLNPCFHFEEDGGVGCYFFGKSNWEKINLTTNLFMTYRAKYHRPVEFLAPEICDLVEVFNDHILEEIKYLTWKIFIKDRRKLEEFSFLSLCINRIKINIPSELLFLILSFLKGHELLFKTEIVNVDKKPSYCYDPTMFPKLS